jgi:glucokinase
VLAGVHPLRAEDVVAAAAAGDPLAIALWAETTDLLGQALTDLVNVLEPDLLVLGGGVTRAGDLLLEPVRRAVAANAMPPAAAAVQVELTALGDASGVVGAAAVALERWHLPQNHLEPTESLHA